MSLPPHLFRGPWKKYSVIKIPLAPFYPPLFCPRQARDQRNVDSPSAAVRAAARGLLYGQEQMAVAQVDPPTTPPTRAPSRGGYPTTTTPNHHSWGALTKLGHCAALVWVACLLYTSSYTNTTVGTYGMYLLVPTVLVCTRIGPETPPSW